MFSGLIFIVCFLRVCCSLRLRSLATPTLNVAWRHPNVLDSVQNIVKRCSPIDDGMLLFGSVTNLDHPTSSIPGRYTACTEMRYGFLITDWTYVTVSMAGCPPSMPNMGHSGSIVGASIPIGNCELRYEDDVSVLLSV